MTTARVKGVKEWSCRALRAREKHRETVTAQRCSRLQLFAPAVRATRRHNEGSCCLWFCVRRYRDAGCVPIQGRRRQNGSTRPSYEHFSRTLCRFVLCYGQDITAALVLMLFSDLYYDLKLNYRLFSTKDASEHLESPQKWHYKYRF